jgi:hypothetical protein
MADNDAEGQNLEPMHRRISYYLSSLLFAGAACTAVHAAELGDARVGSHIGQPLVADIELIMIDDPGQAVQVRVADPEVYSGAGIALPPVLTTLHLSVMRRDGHQYLHITSLRPVDADHVHLYLDLDDKGQHSVRLATLWLTPDPNPAAPMPAAPAPAPATNAEPDPQAWLAAHPPAAQPEPAAKSQAAAARQAVQPARSAIPAALAHLRASAAPACVHDERAAQACAVLGVKNAELRAQLGRLEDKVKGLQATLDAPPAPAVPEAHPEPEQKAGPKPIHSIKPLMPRKPKEEKLAPEPGLPWGRIGAAAGALAVTGGAVAAVLRRRRRSKPEEEPAPAAEQAEEPVVEPTLE